MLLHKTTRLRFIRQVILSAILSTLFIQPAVRAHEPVPAFGIHGGTLLLCQGQGRVIPTRLTRTNGWSSAGPELGISSRVMLLPRLQLMFETGWGKTAYPLTRINATGDPQGPVTATTMIVPAELSVCIYPAPRRRLSHYLRVGGGAAYWQRDISTPGTVPADGFAARAWGGTALAGTGVEIYLSRQLGLDLAALYRFVITHRDMYPAAPDTVHPPDHNGNGLADEADAEINASVCLRVSLVWYPGRRDDFDGDGIHNVRDNCWDRAENVNGFRDHDGCPDTEHDRTVAPGATDQCPDAAEDHDWFRDGDGCPDPDNDGDGIPDSADACPGTDVTAAEGTITAENRNGLLDADGCPDTLRITEPDGPVTARKIRSGMLRKIAREIKKGAPLVLTNIPFKTGSAELTPAARSVLYQVYESLVNYPDMKLEIRGYADITGTDAFNLTLSQARAESVLDYMTDMGLARERFTARGFGRTDPIADNATAEGRAQNRRVEFHRVD